MPAPRRVARGGRAGRSAPRSETRPTGPGRFPASATRARTVLVVGLAPAAHGGNRTGRVFTGDRSGDFLFASMFRCGFANQPTSVALDDGLVLRDAYVAAAVRCAPPANKPTTGRTRRVRALPAPRARAARAGAGDRGARRVRLRGGVVGAARVAGARRPARRRAGPASPTCSRCPCGRVTVLGAFHPSQQNTFTGRLTPDMLDAVFERGPSSAERE